MPRWEVDWSRPEGERLYEVDDEPRAEPLAVGSSADILASGGILRAPEVVELAAAAGLDLAAAATALILETGGGRMVWGHDPVPTAGAYVPGSEVTEANYAAYRAAVHAGRAGRQGCGALQITFGPYQDRADAAGGCWNWAANVSTGFQILADLIQRNGLRGGFRQWNGSGPAAEHYADNAMAKYGVWRARLAGAAAPNGSAAMDSVWDRKERPWGGGITNIADPVNGEEYDLFEYVKRNNVTTYQNWLILKNVEQLVGQPVVSQITKQDVGRIAATVVAQHRAAMAEDATLTPAADELETVSFWKATGEQVLVSFSAALLSLLGAGAVDVLAVPWTTDLRLAGGVAVVALLKCLVASQFGIKGTPSFLKGGQA